MEGMEGERNKGHNGRTIEVEGSGGDWGSVFVIGEADKIMKALLPGCFINPRRQVRPRPITRL